MNSPVAQISNTCSFLLDVFTFDQVTVPSRLTFRSSISFKVVPPQQMPREASCVAFRYKTSFHDSWVETINYRHNVKTGRSKTVWQMPGDGRSSSRSWRSATILLPTNETDLAVERVRIRPFRRLKKGYFNVKDLVTSHPCTPGNISCY